MIFGKDSVPNLVERIRSVYQDFDIREATINMQGQNSIVLIVNGEWIFRFPKYTHVLEQMKTETKILTAIQGKLPLKTPEPEFNHLENAAVEAAFMGYRRISGEPLWREIFTAIQDVVVIDRLAFQLGEFLGALHGMKDKFPASIALDRGETAASTKDLYRQIRQNLFPMMRPDAQTWTANHFETFLDKEQNFLFEPVFRHGDFGTSNLLYDTQSHNLNGVIDFSYAALGDPAFDFAGLLSSYGEDFLLKCTKAYPALSEMMERVHFYRGTFALEEALFGFENGDETALKAGMETFV